MSHHRCRADTGEQQFIQAITPALWITPQGWKPAPEGQPASRPSGWLVESKSAGWTIAAINGVVLGAPCFRPSIIVTHPVGAICSSTSRTDHKRSRSRGRQRRSCRGGDGPPWKWPKLRRVTEASVTKSAMAKAATAKAAAVPGKQHVRLRISDSFKSIRLRGRSTSGEVRNPKRECRSYADQRCF